MRRLRVVSLGVVLALCLSMVPLPSQTAIAEPGYYNVPGDYSSIKAAIKAASDAEGGTVNVTAGYYTENIEMEAKVIIQGAGANVTFIDGGGSGFVVKADNVDSSAKLDGFTITNGASDPGGGGIFILSASPTISSCNITGNSADDYGGGIWVHDDSSPTIINCLITGNTAGTWGGGIFVSTFSSPTVINCTLSGNSATDGGGMYNLSSNPTITNSIIYGNGNIASSGPNIYNDSSNPTFSYCNIEECGSSGEGWDSSFGTDGGNNIDADPLFVDPGYWSDDFWVEGDYHLQSDSPCIDEGTSTGAPSIDLDGVTRPQGAGVDMGAYEAVEEISTITIEIDIKPGSEPNSINPDSKGVIPVAILTTPDFDAASVSATTVRFGKKGNEAAPVHYALENVDEDGDIDMVLHFKTQETGISAGDTEATLTGKTTDGKNIIGTDSVVTVPPEGKGKANSSSNPGNGNGQGNGDDDSNPGKGKKKGKGE